MAENGKKLVIFVLSVLGGFIGVALAINTLVFVPLNAGLAQECTKRELADAAIMENIDNKLDKLLTITVDMKTNLAVAVKQIEINGDRIKKLEAK